jgi:hypothetical protein
LKMSGVLVQAWQTASKGLEMLGEVVGEEIVEHDDVAWAEGPGQHLLDVGLEGGPGHGAVEDEGGDRAALPEPGDEGGGEPVAIAQRSPEGHAAKRHEGGMAEARRWSEGQRP